MIFLQCGASGSAADMRICATCRKSSLEGEDDHERARARVSEQCQELLKSWIGGVSGREIDVDSRVDGEIVEQGSYAHGGDSTLERVVPVILLAPR